MLPSPLFLQYERSNIATQAAAWKAVLDVANKGILRVISNLLEVSGKGCYASPGRHQSGALLSSQLGSMFLHTSM